MAFLTQSKPQSTDLDFCSFIFYLFNLLGINIDPLTFTVFSILKMIPITKYIFICYVYKIKPHLYPITDVTF